MNKYKAFDFIEFESKLLDNNIITLGDLSEGSFNFNNNYNKLDDNTKLLMEECAAIMEFDQGLSRNQSEALAFKYVIQKN